MFSLTRLLDRFGALLAHFGLERKIADRDQPALTYLLRYYLIGRRAWHLLPVLVLHRFLMSDVGHLHDHPWSFVSWVLAGGYWEDRPQPDGSIRRKWRGRWSIAWRRATDLHRVTLPEHATGPTYTLVFMLPRTRVWGFAEVDREGIRTWWRWDTYLTERQRAKQAEG